MSEASSPNHPDPAQRAQPERLRGDNASPPRRRTIFTSLYRSPRRITAMGAPEVALGRDRSTGIMETKQTRVVFAYLEHHSLLVYLYQVMVMAT
jgi:hypothetical protein